MTDARIFTVHLHPEKRPMAEHAEFVPERFNWAAFFFGWLWALSHRMWFLTAGLFAFNLLVPLLVGKGWLSVPVSYALILAQALILGFEANDLRRRKLTARGFQLSDVVVEDSMLHAQQRYLSRHATTLA